MSEGDNMSDQAVIDCLVAARKRIENPANWAKGMKVDSNKQVYCALFAMTTGADWTFPLIQTTNLFRKAADCGPIMEWNDAPERTHEEVLAAFDKAIELAKEAA
jgi:hypothetical protein